MFSPSPSATEKVVKTFLQEHAPSYGPNVYNAIGHSRGFPDVAAIGLNVATVFDTTALGPGGTSVSTPIFADPVRRPTSNICTRA